MKPIYVVDALNYLFRSYYAIKGMSNKDGLATNALFGFIRSIEKLKKDFSPEHLVVVFDGPNNKLSRRELYADYKGHRSEAPEDLGHQIDLAKRYCEAAGISILELSGVEADDTMGTIAKWGEKKGLDVALCSSDKDLCQLVSDRIYLLQTHKENLKIDRTGVIEKFGVAPEQFIDYLAITGDASDNIPGIAGFGPKTAATLLHKHGSLKKILDHPEILEKPGQIEKVKHERKNALISQQLATIQTDLEIPKELHFYALAKVDKEALITLYDELNFSQFKKELLQETHSIKTAAHYVTVDDAPTLMELIKKLEKAPFVAIDLETTSLNTLNGKAVGIGLSMESGTAYYIPMNGTLGQEAALHILKPFLTSYRHFVGHNSKYDMHILANHGILLHSVAFDTMIASYLLNSNLHRHNLEDAVQEHLGHTMTPITSLIGKKKKGEASTMEDVAIPLVSAYCCEDVDYTLQLMHLFAAQLKSRSLEKLFVEVEMPLLPVLFNMERHGIYVDANELHHLSQEFGKKIASLQEKIYELAGMEFNINSPKQLSAILFHNLAIKPGGRKTQSGYSTDADTLESLKHDHPIIPLLIIYRTLEKLRSTYVDTLPEQIDPHTHRIHCSFNQSVTATGRLSAKDPNLQNIPIRSEEGRKIRHAFKPQKTGWSFVSLDYSQIELRILADLSEDPNLIEAFQHDQDIHRVTASQVFHTPIDKVTSEMRSRAKAVNFGIIYGQQAFGLSRELDIDVKEAKEFIEGYFHQYPKIKKFLDSCKDQAIQEGKARTALGRERLIPEAQSTNGAIKALGMRLAVNTPIQGTQADIIKMAMIAVEERLKKTKMAGFMILQIHDELVFECPDEEITLLTKEVKGLMEGVVRLKVPLKVDISVGKNWGEC